MRFFLEFVRGFKEFFISFKVPFKKPKLLLFSFVLGLISMIFFLPFFIPLAFFLRTKLAKFKLCFQHGDFSMIFKIFPYSFLYLLFVGIISVFILFFLAHCVEMFLRNDVIKFRSALSFAFSWWKAILVLSFISVCIQFSLILISFKVTSYLGLGNILYILTSFVVVQLKIKNVSFLKHIKIFLETVRMHLFKICGFIFVPWAFYTFSFYTFSLNTFAQFTNLRMILGIPLFVLSFALPIIYLVFGFKLYKPRRASSIPAQ